MRWDHGDYWLTDDSALLDLDVLCRWLQSTYWAANRTRESIAKGLEHSLNFGLFHKEELVGHARVVSGVKHILRRPAPSHLDAVLPVGEVVPQNLLPVAGSGLRRGDRGREVMQHAVAVRQDIAVGSAENRR